MAMTLMTTSCHKDEAATDEFDYTVDSFADIEVLRYKVPGFEDLSLNQKKLIYYLTEAALWGRDILWDQNNEYNLPIRRMLEAVYTNYDGDRNSEDYKNFEKYLKQVWFANGIHHHYSTDKFTPAFSREFLVAELDKLPQGDWSASRDTILTLIFDPAVAAKRVNQAEGQDLIATSANNLYKGVTQAEVEAYFDAIKDPSDPTPVSYGLNTRVVKDENGKVVEQPYKVGGLYTEAIEKIVENLEQAEEYAENDAQR